METITTIQIRENVKNQLDRMKSGRESYEEVILNLMKQAEQCKRSNEELLIEGCKAMAEESLKITKEWESTDAELDWECEGLIPNKFLKK
jgi:predicted CopG family antitoxin